MKTAADQSALLDMTIWKAKETFSRDNETITKFWKLRGGPMDTTVSMYLEMKPDYLKNTLGEELYTQVTTWIKSLGIENLKEYPLFREVV